MPINTCQNNYVADPDTLLNDSDVVFLNRCTQMLSISPTRLPIKNVWKCKKEWHTLAYVIFFHYLCSNFEKINMRKTFLVILVGLLSAVCAQAATVTARRVQNTRILSSQTTLPKVGDRLLSNWLRWPSLKSDRPCSRTHMSIISSLSALRRRSEDPDRRTDVYPTRRENLLCTRTDG